MRAKGKSMISGSQKRLKRKGSIASSVSGPPSWKSTTPIRRVVLAIPRVSLAEKRCYSKSGGFVNAGPHYLRLILRLIVEHGEQLLFPQSQCSSNPGPPPAGRNRFSACGG